MLRTTPSSRRGPRRPKALLMIAATGTVAAVLAGLAACAPPPSIPAPGSLDAENPLHVPPLAESRLEGDTRVFDLTADESTAQIVDAGPTRTLGYNGDYLGPTLVAHRGEQVRVDVHNELEKTTTLHWHGMHLPQAADGGPHQPIEPGDSWHPQWTIDQPASTLWYHPHQHGTTREQVDAGLAGMFILRDEEEAALDLPREYGVDDFPVIVQDRSFAADGSFDMQLGPFEGAMGNTVLVNGTVSPYLDVATERVRLRLLNGSSARSYNFGFGDGRSFQLIGTDGGLLPAPHETTQIPLSPGERAEIVVGMSPGDTVRLGSVPVGDELRENAGGFDSMAGVFDVLELRAGDRLEPSPQVPAELADVPDPDTTEIAAERSFLMSGFTINNQQMDMDRIDHVSTVDTSEIWEVHNENGTWQHSFHVHDTQFRVLDVNGAPPPPHLAGYKDTIALERETTYRILVRFEDYADPDLPYMYHCHLLWHEDQGMMGQFLVTETGREQPTSEGSGDGHEH